MRVCSTTFSGGARAGLDQWVTEVQKVQLQAEGIPRAAACAVQARCGQAKCLENGKRRRVLVGERDGGE